MGSSAVVDRTVEPLVREIFNAVIVADEARFEEALKSVPDDKAQAAASLALAVDRTVMSDLHDGPPSDERLDYLTNGFIAMERWYRPEGLPVRDFLRTLSGLSADPIEPDVSGLLGFLVGGWLLASFLDSGTHWYEYLDDILDRLDSGSAG
jgi:hypothetical protein